MKVVVKGLNYTEMRWRKKGSLTETVSVWMLQRKRKPEDCGVWIDGEQVFSYKDMKDGKSIKIDEEGNVLIKQGEGRRLSHTAESPKVSPSLEGAKAQEKRGKHDL